MPTVESIVTRETRRSGSGFRAPAATASSVRPFYGADASTGALLVKLGTKVWESAKQKVRDQQLKQQYAETEARIQQQIQMLAPKPSRYTESETVGGRTYQGLSPYEAARLRLSDDAASKADKNPRGITVNAGDLNNPFPVTLTAGEYLTYRHQLETEAAAGRAESGRAGRATAARLLSKKLAGMRSSEARTARANADLGLEASRMLTQLPDRPTDTETKLRALAAADDSLVALGNRFGKPSRFDLAGRLMPQVRTKLQKDIDARRAPYLQMLDTAARSAAGTGMSPEGAALVEQLRATLAGEE